MSIEKYHINNLDLCLKEWSDIKGRWTDKKSNKIENDYIIPLSYKKKQVQEVAYEISDFIAQIESQLEQMKK